MGMVANLLAANPDELERFRNDASEFTAFLQDEVQGLRVCSIDKSWEGLLFLLTGTGLSAQERPESSPGRALFSGRVLNAGIDFGYGPAHYLDAAQTAVMARELAAISVNALEQRYDPAAMMQQGIYPGFWDRGGSDLRDYLMDYFDELKIQYLAAREQGRAMICFLNEEPD